MRKFFWSLFEVVETVAVAVIAVLLVRTFIAQPFLVSGSSMEPNFKDGDYLLVDELSYRFSFPERGDVIIFRYPNDPSQFFIKRIIGLPSETIEIKDNTVKIYNKDIPEGFVLDEKYLAPDQKTLGNAVVRIDDNEYFVLGDNRPLSSDSRRWGNLPEDDIIGRVLLRAWPFSVLAKVEIPAY